MNVAESVLLLVDLQERPLPAIHGGEAALREAIWLAEVAHALAVRSSLPSTAPTVSG